MKPKLKTCDFVKRAIRIHGNEYDYTKSNYLGSENKISIICKTHGEFNQRANGHLNGKGCPKCGRIKANKSESLTQEKFLQKSTKVHCYKFDYSKVNYVKNNIKVEILCKKHGAFYQKPNDHMMGHGCPKCSRNVSELEIDFLNYLNVDKRNFNLLNWKRKPVDGYDEKSNTVYEYLGDYYHGNPKKYNPSDYNQICHKTFGELYENTIKVFNKLKFLGYTVKYIWENDWKKFKDGIDNKPNIISYK
jgi:hypothetical protein